MSDEERVFLQQRLAVSGRVGAVLSLCFYALVNVLAQIGADGAGLAALVDTANLAVLAVALIYASL